MNDPQLSYVSPSILDDPRLADQRIPYERWEAAREHRCPSIILKGDVPTEAVNALMVGVQEAVLHIHSLDLLDLWEGLGYESREDLVAELITRFGQIIFAGRNVMTAVYFRLGG